MHKLQRMFADEEGETAWTQDMHALFGAGAFDEAEALLAEALTELDSELAWTCLELPRDAVVLSGWDEMGEAIALHEGEPVTGVTIAIANEGDRDFAKGAIHRPHVMLGIYTDEAYDFSGAVHWQLLDECHAELPAWAGREEDIEVHLEIEGLDQLNTLLVHHKQRHFFRDAVAGGDEPGSAPAPVAAPLRYVEFVLGCWWRALRWHQAVAAECARRGLPRAIPVVAGMVDMRPEVVAIHDSGRGEGIAVADGSQADTPTQHPHLRLVSSGPGVQIADSFGAGFIQRKPVEEEKAPPSVYELRRRAQGAGGADRAAAGGETHRPGFLARIFGRR